MTDSERCYAAAMRILGYRFNSEHELRRKLQGKKFEKDVVEETIVRLRAEKWLDDGRFAGALTRTRSRKSVGKLRILRELQAAGVGQDEARKAVAENVDAEKEREHLKVLCEKRARLLVRRHGPGYLDTPEGRNKLTGYLLNQGYDAALISEAIKDLKVSGDVSESYHQPDS